MQNASIATEWQSEARLNVPAATPCVCSSVLAALCYSDLFDYPLTLRELQTYQVGTSFSEPDVRRALSRYLVPDGTVIEDGGLYCLRGREGVFRTRRSRKLESARIWRRARVYGRWIARTPFVRMVAVTGALAVDNIGERVDIDFMVVSEPGRVWVCRRLLIAQVRLARLFGDELCPNYIVAQNRLGLRQRDLFTAHELAQMILLYGGAMHRRLLNANRWAATFLPAAFPPGQGGDRPIRRGPVRRIAEEALRSRGLDPWEAWELERLRKRLRPSIGPDAEVVCTPEQCKGHTEHHRERITDEYRERLSALGLRDSISPWLDSLEDEAE